MKSWSRYCFSFVAAFSLHSNFEINPHCCMYEWIIHCMAENSFTTWLHHTSLSHSSVGRHLGYFQFFTITNKLVQTFLCKSLYGHFSWLDTWFGMVEFQI